MKKYFHTLLSVVAICSLALSSCDKAETGIEYDEIAYEVGRAQWSSDVNAADKAVISQLIENMIEVEACTFRMGAQSQTTKKAGYMSGFSYRDTIWYMEDRNIGYHVDYENEDTLWYDASHYDFADTLSNKHGDFPYALVYKNNAGYKVGPVVKTSMPSYFIGKYEITQAEWMAVMHRLPRGRYSMIEAYAGQDSWFDEVGKGDRVAAYNIWYEDAVEFCEALSAQTGLQFRLPTEAEWECAARGGKYSHGYKYAGSDNITSVGWISSNAYSQGLGEDDYGIHAVGELEPNELGIYDMSGNVSEWVANGYYEYNILDNNNPKGKTVLNNGTDTLMMRGGSWVQDRVVAFCVANRKHSIVNNFQTEKSKQSAFVNCGFRIAITAP